MRIETITVCSGELHYAGKAYSFSQGRSYTAFPTTVVALGTDTGLTGYGESKMKSRIAATSRQTQKSVQ